MEPIVNRVAQSDIEVFDLETLWDGNPVDEVDIAPFLHQGLIVREREYRDAVRSYDWTVHEGHHVAVFCSVDTIVPTWAFMLVASKLEPLVASVAMGRSDDLLREYFSARIAGIDFGRFQDAIVVVKGCGTGIVPVSAYVDVVPKIQKVARKLMFGEPCSSVHLWRKKKES